MPSLRSALPEEINTPDKVISGIFKEVDTDGNGSLSSEELINFMKNKKDRYEYYGLHMIFK